MRISRSWLQVMQLPQQALTAEKQKEKAAGPKLEDIVTNENPEGRFKDYVQIGEGVSGCVYKAVDTKKNGEIVAIKQVHSDP